MILVAGDAMIDRYVEGDVERISPEAPVPVVRVLRTEDRPGGAANVAQNVLAMGARYREIFSVSYGHAESRVVKTRIVARNQQIVRVDHDHPQRPIDLAVALEAARDCDIAVLSDYAKGALAGVTSIIAGLKKAGLTVLVDPKRGPFRRYEGADVLKPNIGELRELVGPWASEEEMEQKVKAMQRGAGIRAVLLTRGAEGMTLFAGAVTRIPCEAREVFDVTGAGDTAIAALAVGLDRGMPLEDAARVANRAAGLAVGRFGTVAISDREVFG